MFITWQLCNKTSKFPIKILSYQFNTNNGIILMIIVTQFLKSSQDFLNFSFIIGDAYGFSAPYLSKLVFAALSNFIFMPSGVLFKQVFEQNYLY